MNILVTGSNGQLGSEFKRINLKQNIFKFFFTDIEQLNITNKDSINEYIKNNSINAIINCAAYTNVNMAEEEKEKCLNINCKAVKYLVEVAELSKVKLIHISTDYVYNGLDKSSMNESHETNPVNFYGYSKLSGEKFILNSNSDSIIIRTSWLYSKYGNNFVKKIISTSKNTNEIKVINDQFGCPTYAENLANSIFSIINLNKVISKHGKIFNYSNLGYTSWYDFAKKIIEILKINCDVIPVTSSFYDSKIKRPKYSVTDKSLFIKSFKQKIKNWDVSLQEFLKENYK